MPRILVADDNSNIQKMVSLALKDTGVDVISVGNGEAAVRKLPDAKPDLVLADIFMPVRSGYEVCEFIKHDSRYSHVPVVLLVGAFDPLDEREAQRVGADGILKKPFVPPDPLITMVKGLLAKTEGERLVAEAVPVAVSVAVSSPGTAEAETIAAHQSVPAPPVAEFTDIAPEEIAAPVNRLDFSGQEKTVAFQSLLETTTEETVDDADVTVTATRDPHLGEPAFWSQPAADDASDEEAIEDHSWGRQADPIPFGIDGPVLPAVEAARAAQLVEKPIEAPTAEALSEIKEAGSETAVLELPSVHAIEFAQPDAAANSAALEGVATPAQDSESQSKLASEPSEEAIPLPHMESLLAPPPVWKSASAAEVAELPSMELPSLEAIPEASPDSMAADVPPSANEEEGQQLEQSLPALWESQLAQPVPAAHEVAKDPDATVEDITEVPAWLANVTPVFAGKPIVLPEEAPQVAELVPALEPKSDTPLVEPAEHFASVPQAITAMPATEIAPAAAPLSPAEVEAVVSRIVERMQPKVFDVVTKEILRPLVEALVRREIEKH